MERFEAFERFYMEIGKDDAAASNWGYLARTLKDTPLPPLNAADQAMLAHVETVLDPCSAAESKDSARRSRMEGSSPQPRCRGTA